MVECIYFENSSTDYITNVAYQKIYVYYEESRVNEIKLKSNFLLQGGGSKSQEYLDQLLKTLESYCHSANNGYWTCIIKSFLKKISKCFILRVKRYRDKSLFDVQT